jgi:hypothetical protein
MTTARTLHPTGYVEIASGLQMGAYWDPLSYLHALKQDVARICRGIADLVNAYAAAGAALSEAQKSIEAAPDS